MKRQSFGFILFLLLSGSLLFAGSDFSGKWKLDMQKSDFGGMPAPIEATQVITHADPSLTVQWMWEGDWGQMDGESKYSTDGTETSNSFGQMSMQSKASWEGDNLKIHSVADMGGSDATFDDIWELSADGSAITVNRTMSGPMGEMSQTLVWVKQ